MSKLLHLNFRHLAFIIFVLVLSQSVLNAQGVGISNTTIVPDPSAILELRSTTQGVLVPRITTIQRDAIVSPAEGLLIYNISTSSFNFYKLGWQIIAGPDYNSVDVGSNSTTTSTVDVLVTGMTLTPGVGTYVVNFNGQCTIPAAYDTTGFSTATATSDLNLIYNDIIALPVTNTTHPLAFGSGEIISAGVYSLAGAVTIAGVLTLDGGGNPNAVFVIISTGAINAAAGVNIVMTNGANSRNIYWVAGVGAAIGIGAGTTIPGTIFSGAALALGANCIVSGRLLTKSGAISFGGTISVPSNPSLINMRTLNNFVIFTGLGAVASEIGSTYNGDIGTNGGAITGFGAATVNGTIFQAGSTTVITKADPMVTFSLYNNGVLIPNSSRTITSLVNTPIVSLQGIATLTAGQTIDVRWKIDKKTVTVSNRILTLTKVR